MALMQCPDCAGPVSQLAANCPRCGRPVTTKPAMPDAKLSAATSAAVEQRRAGPTVIGKVILATGLAAVTALAIVVIRDWTFFKGTDPAVVAASRREQDRQADEQRRVAQEDQLRSACGLLPGAAIHPAFGVRTECQTAVTPRLKAPGSAKFPGLLDEDGAPYSMDGCVTIYNSWVDSQNSFGANLRQEYTCKYDPRTGLSSIEFW